MNHTTFDRVTRSFTFLAQIIGTSEYGHSTNIETLHAEN
jgi:hypothetical protein